MTEYSDADQGVSIADIFWRLWRHRGIIILVPLLFLGFAVVFVALSAVVQNRQATYLLSLRNIENQRYPNGTEFSPRDLVIPEVLTQLRSRFDIPPEADLHEAISVAYDSPLAAGVARKYQQRLANRSLTQAEIDTLNQEYLDELRRTMRASLRVSVDHRMIGLDNTSGLALVAELPRLWSAIYTTKYRIFTDRRLADMAITRSEETLATTGSIITANNRIAAMQQGLETLTNDNRFAILRTSEGKSPADLIIELANFNSIWFNPVKAQALRTADTTASAYLEELRLNIADKRRQVAAFDGTLAGLGEYQTRGQPAVPGQPPLISGEPANMVQIGDSAFSGIIDLARQASFSNFVQRTLDQRRELMIELSRMERERDFAQSAADSSALPSDFVDETAGLLRDLTADYAQLLRGAEDLTRSRAGDLWEPLLGPTLTGDPILSRRNVMLVGVAGVAGGLLAVVGVLLAGALNNREKNAKAA